MNLKFLLASMLIFALIVPNAGWIRRRRRRRRPRPPPPPPPLTPCQVKIRDTRIHNVNDFEELKRLAKEWAPAVKLAKREKWKPSSVGFFLRFVNLHGLHYKKALTPSNLPACNSRCFLTTKDDLGCASCTRPDFLRGRHPSRERVPVYVLISKEQDTVEFTYWFFFPYNRGKRVCIGYYKRNMCPCLKLFGSCLCKEITFCVGGYSTFGHHVGDWERIKVKFHKKKMYSIYLRTHTSAITDKFVGEFKWNGRDFVKGKKRLIMHECTHVVAFSAKGSHGFWNSVGNHVYKKLINGATLVDSTSYGEAWNTWEYLKITMYKQQGSYGGEFKFLNFNGRWGNREKSCNLRKVKIDVCVLENGPKGPLK